MKKRLVVLLTTLLLLSGQTQVVKADLNLTSASAVLMESSTGTIVYEKNADEQRSPASITKIMTLLLIFDELDKGTLALSDQVTTSAYAKSMGGSQVFLEEGEVQDVETMIKCIVIASGNDASVAMAEHIAGSESEFVSRMNARAKELGMEHTNFEDCCGLTDSAGHYTTAEDVARMSRELVVHYPQILEYSSIWMEDITHVTRQGSKLFTLANTNKLIRSYDGCNGLKTGSTSLAKYCVSAVAERNDMQMIAVVLGAPDYKIRFSEATAMLNYGFGICRTYVDENEEQPDPIKVMGGVKENVSCVYEEPFRFLDTEGRNLELIEKKLDLPKEVRAPVSKGEIAGKAVYTLDGEEIGSVCLRYEQTIKKATYFDSLLKVWEAFLF